MSERERERSIMVFIVISVFSVVVVFCIVLLCVIEFMFEFFVFFG